MRDAAVRVVGLVKPPVRRLLEHPRRCFRRSRYPTANGRWFVPVLQSLLVKGRTRDIAATLSKMDDLARSFELPMWPAEVLPTLLECTSAIIASPTETKLVYPCRRLWQALQAASCRDSSVLAATGKLLLDAFAREPRSDIAGFCKQCAEELRVHCEQTPEVIALVSALRWCSAKPWKRAVAAPASTV